MVVDFHVHCFPDELAQRALKVLSERAGVPAMLDGTAGDLKRSMENSGIDMSVVLPIATKPSQTQSVNDWAASIQDSRIAAFGSLHPDYDGWSDELRRIKELGLKGIKFHPDYQDFYIDEARMFKVYDTAFKYDLPVIFHAGIDIGLPEPYHCTPKRLLNLVKAFPGGRFIAAHMGGYMFWNEVFETIAGEDIYLDTSYSLDKIEQGLLADILSRHGFEKILFATDSPWTEQSGEIGKIKALALGKEAEDAIMGGNARKLLGL